MSIDKLKFPLNNQAEFDSMLVAKFLEDTFKITKIESLVYMGNIAGSEFMTYANTKLYFCLNSTYTAGIFTGAIPEIRLFDENEVQSVVFSNISILWDNTLNTQKYIGIDILQKNYYFSKIVNNQYNDMLFKGYRITLEP